MYFLFFFLLSNSLKFQIKKSPYYFYTHHKRRRNGEWLYFSSWLYIQRRLYLLSLLVIYLFVLCYLLCRSFILFVVRLFICFIVRFHFHRFFCFICCSKEKSAILILNCVQVFRSHYLFNIIMRVNKNHIADSTDFVLV